MRLHPLCRLGLADGVTVLNIVAGFAAVLTVPLSMVMLVEGGDGSQALEFTVGLGVTARLILVGAIADGLDGVLARRRTSSAVGPLLDSIADVVSFGVAPALFVFGVAWAEWNAVASVTRPIAWFVGTVFVTASFVVSSVLRTAVYTAAESDETYRGGVPNTLAATILVVTYLAGFDSAALLLAVTGVLSYLMLVQTPYPGLRPQDAFGAGAVQAIVVVVPIELGLWFARALLVAALAYLVFGPVSYRDRGITK